MGSVLASASHGVQRGWEESLGRHLRVNQLSELLSKPVF